MQRRLAEIGVRADVLLPPPPQRAYRCEGYGDYIFAVSRLTPLKRLDLLIRALAEPAARHARLVIAGEGESRLDLERLIAALGLSDRVTLLGRIPDQTMLDHLARCRAVCFPPLDEDYGFVTVEAFASRQGGDHLRRQRRPGGAGPRRRDGLVCDPTPAAMAGGARAPDGRSGVGRAAGQRGRRAVPPR